MESHKIYDLVQDRYSKYAASCDSGLNQKHSEKIAKAFGYSGEELTSIPEGSNLGLSCGNPLATANLLSGEVVVDLGSGAGFDVFLAANKVGPTGKAIGVDMNKQMLERARKNAENLHASNITFVEASITSIPLPPAIADCIISNCVINLVPEEHKSSVFLEIFRLLKPGGRVSVSDILAKTQLPADIKHNMGLYVGCIAGASQICDYERYLKDAGFEDVLIVDKESDLNVCRERTRESGEEACCSSNCCDGEPPIRTADASCCPTSCCNVDPSPEQNSTSTTVESNYNHWVGSFQIFAVKPGK